ncbi:MAG: SUMF1/EgtB/PvdO family nonheme iron enzyme [Sedimentisphaerales bacterium]
MQQKILNLKCAEYAPVFHIIRTEVTVRQFLAFVEATGYKTEGEKGNWSATYHPAGFPIVPGHGHHWRQPGFQQTQDDPAVCINFNDAVAFCIWLSKETGENCRLPSEAEWEYACRAGTDGDFAGDVDQMAWHRANSGHRTHPVGQKTPNAWGLYDMHGNVWEWCLDMWHSGYEAAPTDGSPWMEVKAFEPVMCGGTFINPQWWLRSANHMRNNPGNRFSYNQGIRIVRTL